MRHLLEHAWLRRAITIPVVFLLALLALATLPLWLPLCWLVARLASRWRGLDRFALMLTALALFECWGVTVAFLLWLRHRPRTTLADQAWMDANYRLQSAWATGLFRTACRLFRLEFVIEHGERMVGPPVLLIARHASFADTVLPIVYYSACSGHRTSYIMKKELLLDPCLDVVGTRLPNFFLERESDDPATQIEGIRKLLRDRGDDAAVLIYPEGTRFTPAKRRAGIERARSRGNAALAAQFESHRHVLPPRLGGTLALLAENPGIDALFLAHAGFEGASRLDELVRGDWLDSRITLSFWRIPWQELPVDEPSRTEFLHAQWRTMDAEVERLLQANERRTPAIEWSGAPAPGSTSVQRQHGKDTGENPR